MGKSEVCVIPGRDIGSEQGFKKKIIKVKILNSLKT